MKLFTATLLTALVASFSSTAFSQQVFEFKLQRSSQVSLHGHSPRFYQSISTARLSTVPIQVFFNESQERTMGSAVFVKKNGELWMQTHSSLFSHRVWNPQEKKIKELEPAALWFKLPVRDKLYMLVTSKFETTDTVAEIKIPHEFEEYDLLWDTALPVYDHATTGDLTLELGYPYSTFLQDIEEDFEPEVQRYSLGHLYKTRSGWLTTNPRVYGMTGGPVIVLDSHGVAKGVIGVIGRDQNDLTLVSFRDASLAEIQNGESKRMAEIDPLNFNHVTYRILQMPASSTSDDFQNEFLRVAKMRSSAPNGDAATLEYFQQEMLNAVTKATQELQSNIGAVAAAPKEVDRKTATCNAVRVFQTAALRGISNLGARFDLPLVTLPDNCADWEDGEYQAYLANYPKALAQCKLARDRTFTKSDPQLQRIREVAYGAWLKERVADANFSFKDDDLFRELFIPLVGPVIMNTAP